MKFLTMAWHAAWILAGFAGVFALTSPEFWRQFQLWDIRDLLSLGALLISAAGGAFLFFGIGVLIQVYAGRAAGAIRRRRNCPRP
jgi:hypothetical protein